MMTYAGRSEVTQRTVALCVEATKLSAGMLQQAMKKVLDEMQKGVTGHKTKLHHGKQTLRQLMKHNMRLPDVPSLSPASGFLRWRTRRSGRALPTCSPARTMILCINRRFAAKRRTGLSASMRAACSPSSTTAP